MARKVKQYVENATGRDQGKIYVITEMPASQGEKWAMRAFMAMAQSGMEVPEDLAAMGFAGLIRMGVTCIAKAPYALAEPLIDEMMACVKIMPSASNPGVIRPLIEDDIEEIPTRLKLRAEVLSLHSGFSIADAVSTSARPSA